LRRRPSPDDESHYGIYDLGKSSAVVSRCLLHRSFVAFEFHKYPRRAGPEYLLLRPSEVLEWLLPHSRSVVLSIETIETWQRHIRRIFDNDQPGSELRTTAHESDALSTRPRPPTKSRSQILFAAS
jgi:hypothetical protein